MDKRTWLKISGSLLVLALIPSLVLAAGEKIKVRLETATATRSVATSSSLREKIKTEVGQVRTKALNLATGLHKIMLQRVAIINNLITRLSGTGSVLSALKQKGANTSAVETKIQEAKDLAAEASETLSQSDTLIASTTSQLGETTLGSLHQSFSALKQLLQTAHNEIKQAVEKLKEARQMLSQFPNPNDLPTASTTSSSTAN